MLKSRYSDIAETYRSLPKDIGFDYMETVVAELEDELEISWTEAYELFGKIVERY